MDKSNELGHFAQSTSIFCDVDICIADGGHVENFNTKCSFEAIQMTSSKWGSSFQFEQEVNKLVVDHISVNSSTGINIAL
jgi:hypothetical protein